MLIKLLTFDFVVIQLFSCVWLFENPWYTAHQASLSFSIFQSLLKLMSIESMMPSNCLICCSSLLLLPSIFPSIKFFSSESALLIRCPKYQSFNMSISPSSENSGLLSFRMDLFDLLAFQGTLQSLFQYHSWKHQLFSAQTSLWYNSYICTKLLGKP